MSGDTSTGKGQTVLVVEDDELLRAIIVGILDDHGYAVSEHASGESAMAALEKRNDVALLITDIRLAGDVSGLDLAHWVVSNRHTTRVLAISGYAPLAVESTAPCRYSFLRKPFSKKELLAEAAMLLSDRCQSLD